MHRTFGRFVTLVLGLTLSTSVLAGCGSEEKASSDPTEKSSASAEPTEQASELVRLQGAGFTIGLPTEAVEQKQDVPTAAGEVTATIYTSEADGGVVVVALTGLPDNVEPDLDGAVAGSVKQVNGTLKAKTTTELLGNPARAARYTAVVGGRDVTVFARLVLVEAKLFQVQFVVDGRDLAEPPPVFDEILESIKFD